MMTKKLLYLCTALSAFSFTNAQNLISEGFDNVPTLISTGGWSSINSATSVGTAPNWFQGDGTTIPAYAGTSTSCAYANYNSVTGANTISLWLITPILNLQNGDVIKFWTRTISAPTYSDRLQVRLNSTGGASPATSDPTSLGGFTTLLLDINPTLTTPAYPNVWTEQSITVSGLTGIVACKLGFRYFVTNGGPTGANSDLIAIDSFSVDRVLSANSFALNGLKIYPNPATDILNIQSEVEELTKVSITDLNGRVIKEVTNNLSQISLGDLSKGIYMVTIESVTAKKVEKLIIE